MKNDRTRVVKNCYSATKEVMICGLPVQTVSDKKIFHGRPPPLFLLSIFSWRKGVWLFWKVMNLKQKLSAGLLTISFYLKLKLRTFLFSLMENWYGIKMKKQWSYFGVSFMDVWTIVFKKHKISYYLCRPALAISPEKRTRCRRKPLSNNGY